MNAFRIERIKDKPYVIWGTGRVAMAFYEKYVKERKMIPSPLFFADNSPHMQGKSIDDIPVRSAEDFFALSDNMFRRGEALAVVVGATSINLLQIVSQFESRSMKAEVFSAPQLDAEIYFTEQKEDVAKVAGLMADELSRQHYLRMIDNMKSGRCVDFTVYEPNQYFGNDVINCFLDDTVLVDAGVCDGEEIDKALSINPNIKVYAFEPDEESFSKLKSKYEDKPQVRLYKKALWSKEETLYFAANKTIPLASRIERCSDVHRGGTEAVKLDDYAHDATFIKMDIEGAEWNALLGAEDTIRVKKPTLAVCLYHLLEDYVRIPLLIHSYNEGYKFYFRQHSVTSGESVLYALP